MIDQFTADNLGVEINQVAKLYKISSTTLNNLVYSESGGDPNAIGDHGDARGLVQINDRYWPDIPDSDAFDIKFSLDFAAQKIADGTEYQWSVCSCVATARNLGVKIPIGWSADDFVPNISLSNAQKGDLVLFHYKNGLDHVAVIEGYSEGRIRVEEGNYISCKSPTSRLVEPTDPNIVGYWSP